MHEREAGTWLARDGDGRILEIDAAGYPGAEASPDDGRPAAAASASEAAAPGRLVMRPPRTGKSGSLARQREADGSPAVVAARAGRADPEDLPTEHDPCPCGMPACRSGRPGRALREARQAGERQHDAQPEAG